MHCVFKKTTNKENYIVFKIYIKKLLRASVIVNNEKKTCLASCPSSCDESHGNVIPPKVNAQENVEPRQTIIDSSNQLS